METYPRYFAVDGRPVKLLARDDVRGFEHETGRLVIDARSADPAASGRELSKEEYQRLLDELRQPIIERFARATIGWEPTGDTNAPYRARINGHELTIRIGDFPAEAMYLLRVDGDEIYELDDWPAAWSKPRVGRGLDA